MHRSDIISMMKSRRVKGIGKLDDIAELADKYPYCSTFQVLKAIALKEEDSIDFKQGMARAAIAIYDRTKLYDYLVKENLLRRIEEGEELPSLKVEEEKTSVEGEPLVDHNSEPEDHGDAIPETETDLNSQPLIADGSPEIPEVEEEDEFEGADLLSSEPLEEQIMREAIIHLGELEVGYSLESLENDPIENQTGLGDIITTENEEKEKEPLSFGQWLLKIDRKKDSAGSKADNRQIIDRFIQESPQISPVKTAFFSPSQMGKMSLIEDETFVSETLAKIYEKQGDFKKAAKAYSNLGLKYPEKSVYFAALQKKAEEQIKS